MFLVSDSLSSSEASALIDAESGRPISYSTLYRHVRELAPLLRRPTKPLVFLFCRNDVSTVVAFLASVEAEAAVALVAADLDEELARTLIQRYDPDWLIGCSDHLAGHAGAQPWRGAVCVKDIFIRDAAATDAIHPDVGVLLSTSGSTGSPKLVKLRRAAVEHNAEMIARALEISASERPITSLPLHYSYGLSVLNSHLRRGATVVLTGEGLTSARFWQHVRGYGCTSLAGVPYSYQILRRLNLERLDIPSLTYLTQAGGKLAKELIFEFDTLMRNRGGRFYVMYGQTEATARIAILPPSMLSDKLGSAGLVLPEGQLRIERNGENLTTGEVGEVVYAGPNVMLGYAHDRRDLSQGDELAGCLYTGDLGYLDEDSCLYITGRNKRVAKVYGLRVNLDEIEQLLAPHGHFAALGCEEKIRIFYQGMEHPEIHKVRQELSTTLRINHRAFEFKRIDQLPLTPNGKVNYTALMEEG